MEEQKLFALSPEQMLPAMMDLIRIHDMEFALIADLIGVIQQKRAFTDRELVALNYAIGAINMALGSFESRWVDPNMPPNAG